MARSKVVPDPLERRHLLERSLSAEDAKRYAEAYLEADRPLEAVDFYAKAGAEEELDQLVALALESGDAFLLRAARAARGGEPSSEEWSKVASSAEAAGLDHYAETARRQADVMDD